MVDKKSANQTTNGEPEDQIDALASDIARLLSGLVGTIKSASGTGDGKQGTDMLYMLAQLIEALGNDLKAHEKPTLADRILTVIAEWKLVMAAGQTLDMGTVYRQEETHMKSLDQLSVWATRAGVLDIYAYGGTAAENAIAVLMEAARVKPEPLVVPKPATH